MACLGCSCGTSKDKSAGGCRSNGGCASGGCNRHNTYDWITAAGIRDPDPFDVVEISFKNGSRKEFFKNPPFTRTTTGDYVLVESYSGGYDLGQISLSGELVRLQMRRKRVKEDARLQSVIRKAHERDMERLDELRIEEKKIMVRARVISRMLDLNMKVCDVEYQADGRKCMFLYTADGRVDFRELIRHFAKEFKVKIEMRQIGARQESARIGGLGNCGRELCCSTWLAEFKSVNTAAARYQNLAINQTKLSGMCGRLKCCLNYELDTYIDALEDFPDKAEKLKTQTGLAILVKTDVFKRLMYYTYAENRHKFYQLNTDQVWEALALIKQGKFPGSLEDIQALAPPPVTEEEEPDAPLDFENVQDVIQLPIETRKKKKKKKKTRSGESLSAAVEKSSVQATTPGKGTARPSPDRYAGNNRPQRPTPKQEGNAAPPRPPAAPKAPERPSAEARPPQNRPPQNNRPENKPPKPNSPNPPKASGPKQGPPREKPPKKNDSGGGNDEK